MKKLRIVLDTNVFLVILAPKFRLHWIFQSLIEGKFELCVSTEVVNEYEEIISLRYGLEKTVATLDFLLLLPNLIRVTPHFKWNLLKIRMTISSLIVLFLAMLISLFLMIKILEF